jgi:hypothetical protein
VFAAATINIRAQATDPVLLKNWAAPLYWQPTLRETERAAREGVLQAQQAVAGAITPPLVFVGMAPCRIMDTRGNGFTGSFGPPSIVGGTSRTVLIKQSACSVPSTAQAYSLNVTVVPQGGLGYLTIWPTGEAQPTVSTLNAVQGQVLANAAIVPGGTSGSVDIYVTNTTDVILDINGYYAPPSSLALGAGTAAAPSLTFAGDSTSGLYSSGAGTVNVAAGGSSKLTVTSTGVGIGTTPAYPLDVAGDVNLNGNLRVQGNPVLQLPLGSGVGFGNNIGLGVGALLSNTTGYFNTAVGPYALSHNTTGGDNVAIGQEALGLNTSGYNNTAIGGSDALGEFGVLGRITTGHDNIAIGILAGYFVSSGNSLNIHIGNSGAPSDNGTIRIGAPSAQSSFFAAGIRGATTANNDAVPVLIDSNGQLGTVSSSRRFKEDIHDMGDASNGLMRLRPVTFRYTKPFADGSKPIQYGLIAEEVAEVYPDLVARSADGQIETVKYQLLDSMLLNEVQRQQRMIEKQRREIEELKSQLDGLSELRSRLVALETAVGGQR